MTDNEFCAIESSFSGEKIDKVEQLSQRTFTGPELKEYLEHAHEAMITEKEYSVTYTTEGVEGERTRSMVAINEMECKGKFYQEMRGEGATFVKCELQQ